MACIIKYFVIGFCIFVIQITIFCVNIKAKESEKKPLENFLYRKRGRFMQPFSWNTGVNNPDTFINQSFFNI